jgi:hypothetical protein
MKCLPDREQLLWALPPNRADEPRLQLLRCTLDRCNPARSGEVPSYCVYQRLFSALYIRLGYQRLPTLPL